MDEMLSRLLKKQEEANKQRDTLKERRAAIVEVAKTEFRDDLNDEEDAEFRSLTDQIKGLDEEIRERDERIAELNDENERAKVTALAQRRAAQATAQMRVTESATYEKGSKRSFFRDLAVATMNQDDEARSRLQRHAEEVRTSSEYQEFRDLNTTDGTGGGFVPPLWLMNEAIELARAGRPTANLFNTRPLPGGTDTITIPKVATGAATAIQPNPNDPVQETDLTETSITAPVRTIAGQQDVAVQLLDQSPINFDELVFRDLLADYATKLNVQVLSGAGTSGTLTGLLSVSGTNAITYTDATPTVGEVYSKIADAVNQVHTNRFLSPTVMVMHPRRWAWFLAAVDSSQRPLVVPQAQGPNNSIGTFGGVNSQGFVGTIQGIPVVVDPSVPTNLGAGTNEDRILIMRAEDVWLYESSIRTRTMPEVLSGTLTVRLQVYGYAAFTGARYPKSISVIAGTGLIAPTF